MAGRHRVDCPEPDAEGQYSKQKRPIARRRETNRFGGDNSANPPLNGDEIPENIRDVGPPCHEMRVIRLARDYPR